MRGDGSDDLHLSWEAQVPLSPDQRLGQAGKALHLSLCFQILALHSGGRRGKPGFQWDTGCVSPGMQSIVVDSYAVPAWSPVSPGGGSRGMTLVIRNGGLAAKCVSSGGRQVTCGQAFRGWATQVLWLF